MSTRTSGIVGLVAAIAMLAADMLLYGHLGSAIDFWDGVRRVADDATPLRLFAGGVVGPLAAVLYMAGFWHVYLNTRQAGSSAARLMFGALVAMISTGGAYHAVWTVRMLCYKHGLYESDSVNSFMATFASYGEVLYLVASSAGFIACPILLILVLTGRSRYPRWTAVANPGLWIPLSVLVSRLPEPYGAAVFGGYFNLVFAAFFTVSIISTWNEPGA